MSGCPEVIASRQKERIRTWQCGSHLETGYACVSLRRMILEQDYSVRFILAPEGPVAGSPGGAPDGAPVSPVPPAGPPVAPPDAPGLIFIALALELGSSGAGGLSPHPMRAEARDTSTRIASNRIFIRLLRRPQILVDQLAGAILFGSEVLRDRNRLGMTVRERDDGLTAREAKRGADSLVLLQVARDRAEALLLVGGEPGHTVPEHIGGDSELSQPPVGRGSVRDQSHARRRGDGSDRVTGRAGGRSGEPIVRERAADAVEQGGRS